MQINAIRERFICPPAEFGPTPFWFLNNDLNEQRLSRALEEMKSKGIAGVIMHPRTGMEVEYLSDTFWQRMQSICEALKRLEMKGWIYDEYNWPSGLVGGKLLREHPEFKQIGLDYKLVPASQLQKTLSDLPGEPFAAFAVGRQTLSNKTAELKSGDSGALSGGEALIFFLREVRIPMFSARCASWARGETGYLDLLNPTAVNEFMRMTHFEYDRHLRQYYGSPIVGIFTDEPGNYSALPFTYGMPEEFRKRFSRDLHDAIPSLAGQFDGIPIEDHIRNRTSYFELTRDLYVESYFKKISAWASDRGLIFTGHLNEDDRIDRLPASNMSFYAPLSQMQMPGTDLLCDKHGYERKHPALAHANFNPKALSSTAHHCGAKRTLCEMWGGNGWATSPEKLKAVLNWAQACGVNFVNPHAVFMSLRGLRKRDFPASHFPPQPWWSFYQRFSEYISRLSLLNSSGVHVAEILFAFPVKNLWANFDLRAEPDSFADLLEAATETFLRNQLDFDYLFDEVVDTGLVKVEDGKLIVRDEKYSLLLLPLGAPLVPGRLLELAEQFVASGGRILAFGYETPTHDEYGGDVSERIKALFGENKKPNVAYRQMGADVPSGLSWLVKKTTGWVRQDLVVNSDLARSFIYLHRRMDGADLFFVANLSEEEGQAELAFRCTGRPQLWNPEDGSAKNILSYKTKGYYTHVNMWFSPNQAFFFVFTDEPPLDHVDSTNLHLTAVTTEYAEGYSNALEVRLNRKDKRFTRTVEHMFQPIMLPERWHIDYPLRNIMLFDKWKIEILSEVKAPTWTPKDEPRLSARTRAIIEATRAAYSVGRTIKKGLGNATLPTTKYEPLDETMEAAGDWCKRLGIDRTQFDEVEILLKLARYIGFPTGYDYPPAGSRFRMSTTFSVKHIPDDLALVYENIEGGPTSIQLNGSEIETRPERIFVWDDSNLAIPIANRVRKGQNRLQLEWRQPDFPTLYPSVHGIEPVCLAGTFWVEKGTLMEQQYGTSLLPWAEIGLPNYIGSLTYKASFEVPMKYMSQQLFLKFDHIGCAAEVGINNKLAGIILWRPYVLDVTHLLVQGENLITVTVADTAANLLGKPIAAGLIGRPYVAPYWRHRIRFSVSGAQ